MPHKTRLLILAALLSLLFACDRAAEPDAIPPTTAAPTAAPTATVVFDATPTRPPSPHVTSPPATPEPDFAATLVAGTPPRLFASYPSLDGALRAEVVIHDCTPLAGEQAFAYDILRVVDTATGETRFVDGQLQACGGLGAFGLGGLFWSASGRFFYYTKAREGVPDGCGFWTRPISRADTSTWTTADLGGGPVSPDGRLLAVWAERELVVYETDGGEVGRAPAADALALGPIAWSPDGRALAFVQAEMFCAPGGSGVTTVSRVEVPAMAGRVLLRSDDPAIQTIAWDEANELRLWDDAGREWRLDANGGELAPPRP